VVGSYPLFSQAPTPVEVESAVTIKRGKLKKKITRLRLAAIAI
jgi:hypothetical protein